jgi:ATP-dependent metalloprotease
VSRDVIAYLRIFLESLSVTILCRDVQDLLRKSFISQLLFKLTILQLQGMLCSPFARALLPRPPFPIRARFLTSISTSRFHRNSSPFVSFGHHYILASTPCSRRTLTLGSIFSRSKTEATPTPHVVALITRLEAEANVHPQDISKQLALFEALLDTKLHSSYELVVTRWERMCEFVSYLSDVFLANFLFVEFDQDPSSPLLQSDKAFKIYISSLQNIGQTASIPTAVERRDSLLASQVATVAAKKSEPLEVPASSETVASTPLVDHTPETSMPHTSSQAIAKEVLSKTNSSSAFLPPPTFDALKSPMAADASQTTPIQVSIVESK